MSLHKRILLDQLNHFRDVNLTIDLSCESLAQKNGFVFLKTIKESPEPKFQTISNVLKKELNGEAEVGLLNDRCFISVINKDPKHLEKVKELTKRAGVTLTTATLGKEKVNKAIEIDFKSHSERDLKLAAQIIALCIKITAD